MPKMLKKDVKMEEKTTSDKIKAIEEKEKLNQEKQNSLWQDAEDLRKAKANLILQHFKDKNILGLMTWTYDDEWGNKIRFKAKEDWTKCPEELVSLLNPDYHSHFYFGEYDEGIDKIEKGIKMGIHFSDGDICMTLEIDEEGDKDRIINFLKKYKIKMDTKEIRKKIEALQNELGRKEKIIKFSKEINE